MDADAKEKRRDLFIRREKRWSMNSQRLEEIVAELMKPISDVRRTFDTDLSALLEEYLTEAGLHALDSDEAGTVEGAPNFTELALLVQQSASIYGRKVDFLYQHVLSISDSLHTSTLDETHATDETTTPSRRKRKASVHSDFSHIELESCPASVRCAPPLRPPPTLPRLFLELEPRLLSDREAPLTDYRGEHVGLLTDYHVTWRLQEGLLVEELRCSQQQHTSSLRPVPLADLQAAIEAVSPSFPPPCPSPAPLLPPPPAASTPIPDQEMPPPPSPDQELPPPPTPDQQMPPPTEPKLQRKRKNNVTLDELVGTIKLIISKEGHSALSAYREFSLPSWWQQHVVQARSSHILQERDLLRRHHFHNGFPGWSAEQAAAAAALVSHPAHTHAGGAESDDDGFFEQSSLGDSDGSRVDDTILATNVTLQQPAVAVDVAAAAAAGPGTGSWSSWQASVLARAAQSEASGADVTELADRVMCALSLSHHQTERDGAHPFTSVLTAAARHHHHVSKLFLATLFLANAGNVEVIQGPPLTLDSFSLRVLSRDRRLYTAVVQQDHAA